MTKKYKQQLDRIEQKVDALLQAELNKMPKVVPPPYVPTNTCSRCGLSFSNITNYSCQDPYCTTFMRMRVTSSIPLDPADRDWEYDGYGIKRRKGEID